jgi:hypothetical protein
MTNRQALVSAGIGAGLAYFLDPDRGGRRRARARDVAAHTVKTAARAIDTTSRDMLPRTYGTAAELSARFREMIPEDDVLVARARAMLGRVCFAFTRHSHRRV